MEILIKAAQLILSLMIMVGLHELGHMLTAKFFGMRVEKFFIGFPPRIFSKKWGETEYGIGSIPLGGFVKISGMMDESMDKSQLSAKPEPWEFRSKPAWQRLIVMLGGVTVNALLGILIFISITFFVGDKTISKEVLDKYGIVAYPLGKEIGLQTGDRIVSINGKEVKELGDIKSIDLYFKSNSFITVLRDGRKENVYIPHDVLDKLTANNGDPVPFFEPAFPFEIGELSADMPAQKAGLLAGDKIVKVNNISIVYFHQLYEFLQSHKDEVIHLTIKRKEQLIPFTIKTTYKGQIGFIPKNITEFTYKKYSLGESAKIGTGKAFSAVYVNAMGLYKLITGQISPKKSLSGIIGMGKMFAPKWDWLSFWELTGLISMALALMNLLPIPALDGGHVMFLLYEMISGKKPSNRFLEVAQYAGMIMLFSLMAFALYFDFSRILTP